MAHVEDVYADPQGRYVIGRHTCVERLTGAYGRCVDDWCIGRRHRWYAVTEILPDGSGEIVDGSYASETEAQRWAESHFTKGA